ncbi:hypothetical protein HOLleu_16811 [Holothuria leucospilota]|uniref:Uncharacterized protein n=1 Tax=Holothuria leucospilota TaxID=206669 RepID=A0A9Q1C682_HOLLE|nr:hypothetical protein HOLleu_16811 [Holothuria leucospilota]
MLHPMKEQDSGEDSVGTNDNCNTSTQEEEDFEIGLCYELYRSGKGDKTSTVTTTSDTPDNDTPLDSETSLREEDPDPTLPGPDCDPTTEIQDDNGRRGYGKAGEHTESLPTMSDKGSSDSGQDPPLTLRRSTRSTAGYNPNPHNELRGTLKAITGSYSLYESSSSPLALEGNTACICNMGVMDTVFILAAVGPTLAPSSQFSMRTSNDKFLHQFFLSI